MEKMRKPFQGVWNIVSFNWQFYVLSLGLSLLLLLLTNYAAAAVKPYLSVVAVLIFVPTFISLSVSYYVYDLSGLYNLNWLDNFTVAEKSRIININAGFDETSILLKDKFPTADLLVFDFYDPEKHTEVSIKRARKAYPPFPNTRTVTAINLQATDNFADTILLTFAAHEIRNEQERILFFKELKRIIKPTGQIIVTEHLRDVPNFLAYNIGFLHFYSKSNWLNIFQSAGLTVASEQKLTAFISTFTLIKYGAAS